MKLSFFFFFNQNNKFISIEHGKYEHICPPSCKYIIVFFCTQKFCNNGIFSKWVSWNLEHKFIIKISGSFMMKLCINVSFLFIMWKVANSASQEQGKPQICNFYPKNRGLGKSQEPNQATLKYHILLSRSHQNSSFKYLHA